MIQVALFGGTTVAHEGGAAVTDFGGVKPRRLLELLALSLGTSMPKELLAEHLWEGSPPSSYVATLESYVCVLRRHLGHDGPQGTSPLVTSNRCYLLSPELASVDLLDARARLDSGDPYEVANVLEETEGKQLLASEPYAPWASDARATFSQTLASACTTAAHAIMDENPRLAASLARKAVNSSYFSEGACLELMQAMARLGERAQAVTFYSELRHSMLEELGVEPGPALHDLYLKLLRGEAETRSRNGDRLELRVLLILLDEALEEADSLLAKDAVIHLAKHLNRRFPHQRLSGTAVAGMSP